MLKQDKGIWHYFLFSVLSMVEAMDMPLSHKLGPQRRLVKWKQIPKDCFGNVMHFFSLT
jgi:hypothetical protein